MSKCSECGLLAFRHPVTQAAIEATLDGRAYGHVAHTSPDGTRRDEPGRPVCILKKRNLAANGFDDAVAIIRAEHDCKSFTQYIPGIGPVETWKMGIQDETDKMRHRQTMLIGVITAMIGFVGSIVAAILTVYLTK